MLLLKKVVTLHLLLLKKVVTLHFQDNYSQKKRIFKT